MEVGELIEILEGYYKGDEIIVTEPPYSNGRTPRRMKITGVRASGAVILTTESLPGEKALQREEQIQRAERSRQERETRLQERKKEIARIKDPEERRKARERMKREEASKRRKAERKRLKRKEAKRASTDTDK